MVHTADVRITLTEHDYQYILQEYGQTKDSRHYRIRNFAADGLTEIRLYTFFGNQSTKHYLRVTMNLAHVLTGRYDPLALYDGSDFQILAGNFEALMASVTAMPLPPLSQWTTCRIDYAYDAKLEPDKNVGTPADYVALAKRGLLPQQAVLVEKEGWMSCREENGSVRINCYDKGAEIRERKYPFDEDVCDRARNVLRFEVQCLATKLKCLVQNAKGSGRSIEFFISADIWRQIISEYGHRVIGEEPYFSILHASLFLRRCAVAPNGKKLRSDVVENLLDFIKAIDTAGGLGEAINSWKQQKAIHIRWTKTDKNILLNDSQRRSRMRQLRQLKVNPLPVPAEMNKYKLANPLQDFWDNLRTTK